MTKSRLVACYLLIVLSMIASILYPVALSYGADDKDFSSQTVIPDSLVHFVDQTDAELIWAFEEWVQSHKALIVQYWIAHLGESRYL